jgi:hypothetical protein
MNYNGYGGGYVEVVRIPGQDDYDNHYDNSVDLNSIYPLAVPGSYVLRNNQGVVQIKNYDSVIDGYDYSPGCYFAGQATFLPCSMANIWELYPGSFKYRRTFIIAQAQIVCSAYTINGVLGIGKVFTENGQDQVGGDSNVINVGCNDGSLPVWGEAQFMHGIQ